MSRRGISVLGFHWAHFKGQSRLNKIHMVFKYRQEYTTTGDLWPQRDLSECSNQQTALFILIYCFWKCAHFPQTHKNFHFAWSFYFNNHNETQYMKGWKLDAAAGKKNWYVVTKWENIVK